MGKIGFCDHCKKATTILKPNALHAYKLVVVDRNQDRILKQAELCDECYDAIASYFEMGEGAIRMTNAEPVKHYKDTICLTPGTRTHHRWTKEEDDFILHNSAGMTYAEMAVKLGVTKCAVKVRKSKLLNGYVDS